MLVVSGFGKFELYSENLIKSFDETSGSLEVTDEEVDGPGRLFILPNSASKRFLKFQFPEEIVLR